MSTIMNKAELAAALSDDRAGDAAPGPHRRLEAEDIILLDRATHCCLGTVDVKGRSCLSLVVGAPGFVRMADEATLLVPEEAEQAEALRHVLEEPEVTLLLFTPGIPGELLVRGRGSITNDPRLLAHLTSADRRPDVTLFVEVRDVIRRGLGTAPAS